MSDSQIIGTFIQNYRESANLTQEELGQRIGVSGSMIAKWESGLEIPPMETMERMGKVLADASPSIWDDLMDDGDDLLDGIDTIADHYSLKNQEEKTIEEMAELTAELVRDIQGNGNIHHIAEELADVQIMLFQVTYLKGFSGEVNDYIRFKINRQLERIANENKTDADNS